jgi:uncharacterized protein
MKFRQYMVLCLFLFGSAVAHSADTEAADTEAADAETGDTESSKILVYGASGRVGSRVVIEALDRGHIVTAVSRDPSRITVEHERLVAVAGDILDPNSVAALLSDQDVVVVSVRGSADDSKDADKALQRVAVEIVTNVIRETGDAAPRLIHVGGAGSLEVKPGVTYADTIGGFKKMLIPAGVRQEIQGQVLTLEYLRTVEDVSWTYISPAKKFEPGERTGMFRVGGDQMLTDAKGKSKISMEDFAVALVDEIENAEHVQERMSVAY